MKSIVKITLTALMAFATLEAGAQYRWYGYPSPYQRMQRNMERNQNPGHVGSPNGPSRLSLALNYGLSLPLGDLRHYSDKTSFNGWNARIMYHINPRIAAGLGVGFYDFYQKLPRALYQDKNTTISAVQSRTLQYAPIQPTVIYTPRGDQGSVRPYLGLGVGGALVSYNKYWGEFADGKDQFAFSVSPMAGILVPFSKDSRVKLHGGVKYNYTPFSYNEIGSLNSVEANVGISLHL